MIAKNISNVKANKTLNNKEIKGSFLIFPEYAISQTLSKLTSET